MRRYVCTIKFVDESYMEIELAWSSLLKIIALGAITYIVAPFLMVIRDSILWWIINNVVVSKKDRQTIGNYALDKSWLDCADILPFRVIGSGEDQKFYLNNKEVSAKLWLHQKEHWEKTTEKVAEQEAYINALEKRVDRLLFHYKLAEANPVKTMREHLYFGFCKSFSDSAVGLESQT